MEDKDMDRKCCSENEPQIDNDCCVEEVGEMVQKIVRVLQLFERDQIKVHGFTSSQFYVLIELFKAESLSMNELSDKMNLNTSTMTRILDNLVRDKYIEREKNETDRRVVIVRLTEKGQEAAMTLNNSVNNYYKKIIQNIPEDKLNDVLSSVNLLQKAFEKANPNCC